jgi:hypothetical protein
MSSNSEYGTLPMVRHSRFASPAPLIVAFTAVWLLAADAFAEPNDQAALELAKKAIESDYLGTKFAEAKKKLDQALALCGPKSCSNAVVARLHRDLGVVHIGGFTKPDEGKAEFVAALKADPTIALDPDLTSEEVQAAFNEAKLLAGGAASAPPSGGSSGSPTSNPPTNPPSSVQGDLVHTPPAEQTVMTPVPIYAELAEGVVAAKVVLQYRPFGAEAWKSLEMPKVKQGYGLEVPCFDVGGVTGQLKYFIQAFDADNNMVSFAGTRNAPISVTIKLQLDADPPHLPGQAPSPRCADRADCPPGIPGCAKEVGPDEPPPEAGSTIKKNWLSLSFQQDWLGVSGAKNTCSGGNEYACFEADEFYAPIPYDKSGGELAGGMSIATSRLLIGYERIFGKNISVGARVGFAFGGGPQAPEGAAFIPVHAEARAAYWFGADPFSRSGLRPYLTLGGGLAQVDASVEVSVYTTEQDFIADKRQVLDAWKKSGLVFIAAGGGAMYAIKANTGPFAELRVVQLFGSSGTALGATIGYAYGF